MLNNSNSKRLYNDEEMELAAQDVVNIIKVGEGATGKMLLEIKPNIPHGQWEVFLNKAGITRHKARELINTYETFKDDEDNELNLSIAAMTEISRSRIELKEPIKDILKYIQDKDNKIKFTVDVIREAKRIARDYDELDEDDEEEFQEYIDRRIDLEELTSFSKPKPTEAEQKIIDEKHAQHELEHYVFSIEQAAKRAFKSDYTAQETLEKIEDKEQFATKIEVLLRKLQKMAEELGINT